MRTKRPRRKGGPERPRAAGGRGVSDAASEDEPGTRHGEACSWGGVVECTGSELTPPPTTGSGLSDPEIPFNSSVSQSLVVPGARIPRRGVFVMPLHFSGWLERVPAPYGRTWVLPGAGPLPLVLIGHAHPQPRLQGVPPVCCPQLQNQEARCPQTAGRLRGPQSPRTHASSCAGVEITGLRLLPDGSSEGQKPPTPEATLAPCPPRSPTVPSCLWHALALLLFLGYYPLIPKCLVGMRWGWEAGPRKTKGCFTEVQRLLYNPKT